MVLIGLVAAVVFCSLYFSSWDGKVRDTIYNISAGLLLIWGLYEIAGLLSIIIF